MDVVPAVFGAAAGLAGLLLVFLGVSMSAFQSYAGDVPAAATAGFRRAGAWILGAFLLAHTGGLHQLGPTGGGGARKFQGSFRLFQFRPRRRSLGLAS